MTKRLLHYFIYSLFGLLVAVLILAAWLAARLAEGPLPLPLFLPAIERTLNQVGAPFLFTADGLVVKWRGWHDGMDLSVVGLKVRAPESQEAFLGVPELVLGLSSQALRAGAIALGKVTAYGMQLRLEKGADGRIGLGVPAAEPKNAGSEWSLHQLLAEIQTPASPDRPASYLEDVGLKNTSLELVDLPSGQVWRARVDSASLKRWAQDIRLAADLGLESGADQARLKLDGTVRGLSGDADLSVQIAQLRPADFAPVVQELAPLSAIDLPVKGTAEIHVAGNGQVERVGFTLAGGAGALSVSKAMADQLGEPGLAQRLPVDSIELQGSFSPPDDSGSVKKLAIAFAKDATVLTPAPLNHGFPLRSVDAVIDKQADRIDVKSLTLDLAGPKITAKATIEGLTGAPSVSAQVAVRDLKMDEIRRYWPASVAPGGLTWCAEHLSRGVVNMPSITLALADRGKGLEITTFNADITAEGARVDYLPPLPAIEGASATGKLDLRRLAINILGGTSIGLQVEPGTVVITDFDKPVESIAIDLPLTGPLRSAIEVLSRKPLAYTEGIGLKPDEVSGSMAMRLQLGFPLLAALPMASVDLLATADLSNAAIVPGIAGIAVRDGNLRLRVDTNDLTLQGPVSLAEIPGRIIWQEHFQPSATTLTQIEFRAFNVGKAQIENLSRGLPVSRVLKQGRVDGDFTFTRTAKPPYRLEATFNVTNAELAVEELGWHKPAGVHSVLKAVATFTDSGVIAINPVSVYGGGLVLDGAIDFDPKGDIEQIEVQRLISGRTDIAASIVATPGGWDVNVNGPSLDLVPLLTKSKSGEAEKPPEMPPETPPETPAETPSIWVAADVDRVWADSDNSFTEFEGTAVREGSIWTLLQVQATGPQDSILTATVTPGDGATRELNVHSDNAGATLQALDLYDTMRGGTLTITGKFDDTKVGNPLDGILKIKNYTIVQAPVLARLLSILALTGIADTLKGVGISFALVRAPFSFDGETLTLKQAEANGPAIGLTASGTISVANETADIRGTIVPFYFINSALGRLPLIGDLFTGGQAGGGLLAANFTIRGSLDDPQISVNPLSVFAPGILREIFIFLEDLFLPPSVPAEFVTIN